LEGKVSGPDAGGTVIRIALKELEQAELVTNESGFTNPARGI
jgi:hypothetical protein